MSFWPLLRSALLTLWRQWHPATFIYLLPKGKWSLPFLTVDHAFVSSLRFYLRASLRDTPRRHQFAALIVDAERGCRVSLYLTLVGGRWLNDTLYGRSASPSRFHGWEWTGTTWVEKPGRLAKLIRRAYWALAAKRWECRIGRTWFDWYESTRTTRDGRMFEALADIRRMWLTPFECCEVRPCDLEPFEQHDPVECLEEQENAEDYRYDDEDDDRDRFYYPGGNSSLYAERGDDLRLLPCPNCDQPNRLTQRDRRAGYQCDACADHAEGVGVNGRGEY